jgi:hypothetical protein
LVVPLLNVFGFIHFSRDVPDGKDVNRSFPGSKTGSLASRIAHHYTTQIFPHIHYGIDLHTGGARHDNYPQVRYTEGDGASKRMAEIFNAPLTFSAPLIGKSFRKATFKKGIPTIVYEAGESMRFDDFSIKQGIQGILNLLVNFEMIDSIPQLQQPQEKSKHLLVKKWLRAPTAGMFIPKVTNGAQVKKKQVLGIVVDTFGNYNKEIKAPFDGYVFCINHQAVVNQGDALLHVGG